MWAGLWQKRAKFTDTNTAIAYQQHGFFEQAQNSYEAVSLIFIFITESSRESLYLA